LFLSFPQEFSQTQNSCNPSPDCVSSDFFWRPPPLDLTEKYAFSFPPSSFSLDSGVSPTVFFLSLLFGYDRIMLPILSPVVFLVSYVEQFPPGCSLFLKPEYRFFFWIFPSGPPPLGFRRASTVLLLTIDFSVGSPRNCTNPPPLALGYAFPGGFVFFPKSGPLWNWFFLPFFPGAFVRLIPAKLPLRLKFRLPFFLLFLRFGPPFFHLSFPSGKRSKPPLNEYWFVFTGFPAAPASLLLFHFFSPP